MPDKEEKKPKTQKSKPDYIASMLEKKIVSGEYKVGDPLPSLQELGNTFGVSPRTMREAFKNLEARGLIDVSQGRRAIVRSDSLEMFVESMFESMQVRMKVEKHLLSDLLDVSINLMASCARSLSRDPDRLIIIKPMRSSLEIMKNTLAEALSEDNQMSMDEISHDFNEANFHFHEQLLQATNNIILNTLLDNFKDQMKLIYMKIEYSLDEMHTLVEDHKHLIYALEHGHTDLAVALSLVDTTQQKDKFRKVTL